MKKYHQKIFKPPSRLRNWQKSLKKSGHFIIKKPPKNVSKSSKWPHSIDSGHTAIKTDASSSMMTLKSRRFSLQARAKFSRFGCRAHVRSLASAFGTTCYNWIQLTHIGPDKKEQGLFKTTFMDMVLLFLFNLCYSLSIKPVRPIIGTTNTYYLIRFLHYLKFSIK